MFAISSVFTGLTETFCLLICISQLQEGRVGVTGEISFGEMGAVYLRKTFLLLYFGLNFIWCYEFSDSEEWLTSHLQVIWFQLMWIYCETKVLNSSEEWLASQHAYGVSELVVKVSETCVWGLVWSQEKFSTMAIKVCFLPWEFHTAWRLRKWWKKP